MQHMKSKNWNQKEIVAKVRVSRAIIAEKTNENGEQSGNEKIKI